MSPGRARPVARAWDSPSLSGPFDYTAETFNY
jgi:hypothetical protein